MMEKVRSAAIASSFKKIPAHARDSKRGHRFCESNQATSPDMRRRGAAALIAARLLRGKAGEPWLNVRRVPGSSG
jgi:hypothetical protein